MLRIPSKKSSPLAYRLLIYILLSSSVITLVITSYQLYSDYQNDIVMIKQRFGQIKISYLNSLSRSVWNFNEEQYEMQLKGILSLDDIVYVAIVTPENKILAAKGEPKVEYIIKKIFPLKTEDFGRTVDAGRLVVVASLKRIYYSLFRKVFVILISQGIKTFIVSMIIILLFYFLVTKRLWTISGFAKSIDLTNDEYLKLDKGAGKDEIDLVAGAINRMKKELKGNYDKINQMNLQLESKVAERTRELEIANIKLEKLATHDGLTGIYNRRKLDDLYGKYWQHAYRNKSALALGMIDIDYFKHYNDTYGHGMGDTALKKIAATIKESTKRPFDVAARYGGEEFMIMLIQIDYSGFKHILERIRKNVELLEIEHKSSDVSGVVTVSIGGIFVVPGDDHVAEKNESFKLVDHYLYEAKKGGRNRIVCAKKPLSMN